MNRRGFVSRLLAAPLVALSLLKAPVLASVDDDEWRLMNVFGPDGEQLGFTDDGRGTYTVRIPQRWVIKETCTVHFRGAGL